MIDAQFLQKAETLHCPNCHLAKKKSQLELKNIKR